MVDTRASGSRRWRREATSAAKVAGPPCRRGSCHQEFFPQQFLYFFRLPVAESIAPHGHGSLRPTLGVSRLMGFVASSMALSTMSPPLDADCVVPLVNALPALRSGALSCVGNARGKFSKAASELADRKTLAAISPFTLDIISSNMSNASALYSTSGSRWP